MSTAAQKEKQKDSTIKKFNNSLRRLLTCVGQVIDDPELEQIRMAANQAIAANDLFAINNIGPYLFQYKEKIFDGDIDYFLNADLGEEVREMDDIIAKVRIAWSKCNEEEQSALYDIIHAMATLYLEYVLLEKS